MGSYIHPIADSRLLRAARRYEALASDDRTFIWVMDPQLRPTGTNAAWEAYSGQSREQYRDLGWLDALADRDRDRCLRQIEAHVPGERPFAMEVSIRRRDGVYRRHFVRAIPVRDEHGALAEWIGTATDVETERSAADQLRDAEERLWLTHDAAGVGTWEWYPGRGELRWSNQMYRLLGFEPGAILPSLEAWISAIHPDDVAAATCGWVAALDQADSVVRDVRVLRPDGETRWLSSRATVIRDDTGEVVRVVGVDMDVTERRLIEDRMAAALAEHQDLRGRLVALTDGAEAVLRAGGLADARRAICALAGRVLHADAYAIWALEAAAWRVVHSVGLGDEFVDQRLPGSEVPFGEPHVADDLQLDLLAHRAMAHGKEGIHSYISVPLPIHGVRRGMLVAYYRTPHQTTEPERQVAVALGHLAAAAIGSAETHARQDHMRLEAERHSRRMAFLAEAASLLGALDSEASFRGLAELAVPSLGDWCAIDVERDGRLQRVAVAHPDPELLLVARQLDEGHPMDLAAPHGVARVLRTGEPELYPEVTDELVVPAAGTPELKLHSAILAPLAARGRTLGVLTLVTSTSGRRYDESDLRFVEDVARRAAMAIDNARLFEEAQRASRAKDEFLALLSHELRTPLNAIMGWAQVLLNPGASDAEPYRRRAIETILRNARLQADLVDGLLDVARASAGGMPLARRALDVAAAAAAVIEGMRPMAAARGLHVDLAVEAPGSRVLADPNRFQQILSNLLSNALKFTEAGGRVHVRVRQRDRWCEVEVADTGAGIDPEHLPYVFERFWQADSSTTRAHGGLGLGLWLVQELVERHGGTAHAYSEGPGCGATFTVRLPAIA